MEIETLKSSDLSQVISIEKESFPDPWGKFVINLKFERQPQAFRVIKEGEDVLGFYCAEERETTNTKGEKEVVALVSNIAVSPNHRGKGIGKKLLEDAVSHLKQISSKRIVLHTRIDNEAMIRLSLSLDFRMLGIVPNFYSEFTRDAYEFEYPR